MGRFFSGPKGVFSTGRLPPWRHAPTLLVQQTAPSIDPSGTRLLHIGRSVLDCPRLRVAWVSPPCLAPVVPGLPHCHGPFTVFGNLPLRWRRPQCGQPLRWTWVNAEGIFGGNGTPLVGHLFGRSRCRVMFNAHPNSPREGYGGFRQVDMFYFPMTGFARLSPVMLVGET